MNKEPLELETNQPFRYKVRIPIHYQYEDIIRAINNGAKFKMYPFTLGLGKSFIFYSKVYLVENRSSTKLDGLGYAVFSLMLGWLSIPYGPYRVIICLRDIFKGGIDVTDDILVNISEQEFLETVNGNVFQVSAIKATQFFKKMDRLDQREMKKVAKLIFNEFQEVELIAFGIYVNTDSPYNCIGIEGKRLEKLDQERIMKLIRTKFYARSFFDILHLNANEELALAFKSQGSTISRF